MSKVFDALRRAEAERRRRADQSKAPQAAPEQKESTVHSLPVNMSGLPEGFLRELGILRNAIDSTLKEKPKKTILFASATQTEGTTTIGVSFARLLALQGEGRILLCEMNARNPWIMNMFALRNGPGVSDFFSGSNDLSSITHTTENNNLDVIHVGEKNPTIIQIHLKKIFPELVQQATAAYDTVIFDAPPIVSSPETPLMSAYVDGVVLVVHAGRTKREIVQRSLDAIARSDGNVLGIILNRKRHYIPGFLYRRI